MKKKMKTLINVKNCEYEFPIEGQKTFFKKTIFLLTKKL